MDGYEKYIERFKKEHKGSSKGSLTKQAYGTYHGIGMTAQRAGLKPGVITRREQEKGKTWRQILSLIGG